MRALPSARGPRPLVERRHLTDGGAVVRAGPCAGAALRCLGWRPLALGRDDSPARPLRGRRLRAHHGRPPWAACRERLRAAGAGRGRAGRRRPVCREARLVELGVAGANELAVLPQALRVEYSHPSLRQRLPDAHCPRRTRAPQQACTRARSRWAAHAVRTRCARGADRPAARARRHPAPAAQRRGPSRAPRALTTTGNPSCYPGAQWGGVPRGADRRRAVQPARVRPRPHVRRSAARYGRETCSFAAASPRAESPLAADMSRPAAPQAEPGGAALADAYVFAGLAMASTAAQTDRAAKRTGCQRTSVPTHRMTSPTCQPTGPSGNVCRHPRRPSRRSATRACRGYTHMRASCECMRERCKSSGFL